MIETPCTNERCPVAVPHTHVVETADEKVKIIVAPEMVQPGMWNSDNHAQYAIAMDSDNGDIVWHRSADWALYGRMYGFSRVARIFPEMPCDGPEHEFC